MGNVLCGSLSCVFNIAAGSAGTAAFIMSLIALNYQTEFPGGGLFPSVWTATVEDKFSGWTTQESVAAVMIFVTVLFGAFPAIGSLCAALSSFCKGGGASGCLACGYFFLGLLSALYWVYRIDYGDSVPIGPCCGDCSTSLKDALKNAADDHDVPFPTTKVAQGRALLAGPDLGSVADAVKGTAHEFCNPWPDVYMISAISFYLVGMILTMMATCCKKDDKPGPGEGTPLKGP